MVLNYGVYINENIEIVVSSKYTIIYRKNLTKNNLETYLLNTDDLLCIGVCITDIPANDCGFTDFKYYSEESEKVRFALGIQANDTFASDDEMMSYLNQSLISFSKSEKEYIFTFNDGISYLINSYESLMNNELTPSNIDVNNDNIDICLQKWHLGMKEIKISFNNSEYIVGIEINTPKHMYIFQITTDFIYCRAARYITCKKGMVFNQNFRQNFYIKNQILKGNIAIYNDNNIASADLDYDESIFGNACVFGGVSIYWSVSSIEKDTITLNGCGGDIYKWIKP